MPSLDQKRVRLDKVLAFDPIASIERKVTIFGKKIQTQTLILSGATAVLALGVLLLGDKEDESIARNH